MASLWVQKVKGPKDACANQRQWPVAMQFVWFSCCTMGVDGQPPCSNRQSTFRANPLSILSAASGAKARYLHVTFGMGNSTLTAGICATAAAMAGALAQRMLFAIKGPAAR